MGLFEVTSARLEAVMWMGIGFLVLIGVGTIMAFVTTNERLNRAVIRGSLAVLVFGGPILGIGIFNTAESASVALFGGLGWVVASVLGVLYFGQRWPRG